MDGPVDGRAAPPDRSIVGRGTELRILQDFLSAAARQGHALLLVGERGSGKSALLDRVAEHARLSVDLVVVRADGRRAAAGTAPTVLRQLLEPLSQHHPEIPDEPGVDADRLVLSTAVLRALVDASAGRRLLLIVDDLEMADPLSSFVCGFIARRLSGSGISLLGASSPSGDAVHWDVSVLHQLTPLHPAACADLVDQRFPAMADSVRHRVLVEGRGNPARLLAIAGALTEDQRLGLQRMPDVAGVQPRLEDGAAANVDSLPAPTARLLLLAALNRTGEVQAVRAAAAAEGIQFDALAAAERAHLVTLDVGGRSLIFAEPSVRAAVVARASAAERRDAHRRLARVAAGHDAESEAWHRAESLEGPDGAVALELDRLARRALAIGDRHAAVEMLLKASEVAASASHRADLLALAAHVRARSSRDRPQTPRLTTARSDRPPAERPQSTATAAYLSLTEGLDPEEVFHFVLGGIAADGDLPSDDPELIELCYILLSCGLLAANPSMWRAYRSVIDRLFPQAPETLRLLGNIAPDVARISPPHLEELDLGLARLSMEGDPYEVLRLGIAAFPVDRLGQCRDALWRLAHASPNDGQSVAASVEARLRLCLDDCTTGQWDEALQLAHGGVALCDQNGLDIQGHTFRLSIALVAACRGDFETATVLAAELSAWALPRGVHLVEFQSAYVRTVAALGTGDFESAYQQARSISEPGTLAPFNGQAVWVCLDLVEAAVHTQRLAEAVAHTSAITESSIPAISPRLAQRAATAQALTTSSDADASALYEQALAVPGADRWVFDSARTQLLYGEHLRRTADLSLAREQLAACLVKFQALGADPWAGRAAAGLRAVGVPNSRSLPDQRSTLTAREVKIASMAASGLTNKEIGERLFLSHRTVGSLLYKIFPKLGVTTRAALHDALAAAATSEDR
jgi:DNA-binding CsgD family transcriptional regulator